MAEWALLLNYNAFFDDGRQTLDWLAGKSSKKGNINYNYKNLK